MKLFKYAISLLFAWLASSQPLLAEENLSDIWLYYSEDEIDTKDTSVLMNFGISQDDSISMSFGETSSTTTNPFTSVTRVITTNEFSLGYNTIIFAPWSMSYVYEHWGKDNEIEVNSFLLNADYFFDKWVTGFSLEYRKIDAYSASQGHASIKSYSLGLNLERDWQDVRWTMYGDWYEYDKDIENITTLELIQLIGLRNYTHTGILVDWSAGSSLRYQFTDSSIAFRYSHSVSAVSDTDSDTFELVFDTTFSDRLMLNLEWGRSYSTRTFREFSDPMNPREVKETHETDYAVVGLGVKF